MKFSTLEEYGLRCMLRIAKDGAEKGLTIPEISDVEGITTHNVAKILRILRIGGFLESSRGQTGGYSLSKPADKIIIGEILALLGGKLYDQQFCEEHKGFQTICTNSIDCSLRSLWQNLQIAIDGVVNNLSLKDLIASEGILVNKISKQGKEYITL